MACRLEQITRSDRVTLGCTCLLAAGTYGLITHLAQALGTSRQFLYTLRARARTALEAGIAAAQSGGRIGDIGYAIESLVRPHGYGIVTELGGHGTGRDVHELPYISNVGRKGSGAKILPGQVLAIEPMVTDGDGRVVLANDGFTYLTCDGSRSAHFEHTILVTPHGAEILTL